MKSEIKRGRPISFLVKMASKTNLHLYEKPNKCLDCGGKLAFNGQRAILIYMSYVKDVVHVSIMIKSLVANQRLKS